MRFERLNVMVQISAWFSFSHWGMVSVPILQAPEWYADGLDIDDELVEEMR